MHQLALRLIAFVTFFIVLFFGAVFHTAANAAPERRLFQAPGRYLIVEVLADDLLHFELSAQGRGDISKPIYTSPMIYKSDYSGPTRLNVRGSTIETKELRATVSEELCVTVTDLIRQKELHRICPDKLESAWKGLRISSPTTRNVYGLGQYFAEESSDGDWLGRVWDPLFDSFGARLRPFAGGANNYSLFPIMYALGEGKANYAIFLDQVYKQMWDFRSTPWSIGTWGDQIRWYVLSGADLPDLRRDYMQLTGKPPIPPRRSFGLWVSEFGFGNWQELRTELAHLRTQKFPVDGFAMDLQWFGGTFADPEHSRMGSLSWDSDNFPDAGEEVQRLRREGVNLMLIEEPYISDTLEEHKTLSEHEALVRDCERCAPTFLGANPWWGRGGMLDFTNPAAGDFWHDYRRQKLTQMGIRDHWADLGEPEQYNAHAWYYGFPERGKHAHADVHNLYAFRWMESIARGYLRHQNSQRPFLLSRSGTSGIQRFGTAMWSGDIGTNWGNLRSQMNAQMHMSLSGIDYYGSDVGGFQRSRGGVLGGTESLYTQWFAASAALDVPVRPHAWNLDKLRPTSPARRGDEASNWQNIRLRYRLAPYYYSLAFKAYQSGDPVFPPLVYYEQDDLNARRLGSEKFIGRDLLVALVADPTERVHSFYLPAGEWTDFHSGELLSSNGQWFERSLYPEGRFRLPLFARSGAIIPLAEMHADTQNIYGLRADGSHATKLIWRLYPSRTQDSTPSTFELFEDDGETFAYKMGHYTTIRVTQISSESSRVITIQAPKGQYTNMPNQRQVSLEIVLRDQQPKLIKLGDNTLPLCHDSTDVNPCYRYASNKLMIVETGMLKAQDSEKSLTLIF